MPPLALTMIFLRFQKALFLAGICLCLTACQLSYSGKNSPKAVDGLLDLSYWDFQKDGPVKLDGQWNFYWKNLLHPEDFSRGELPEKTGNMDLPRSWNGYEVEEETLSGEGHATFHLKIKLPAPERVNFKIPTVMTSFVLYVDGERLTSVGQVGENEQSTLPHFLPQTVSFDAQNDTLDVTLHVANFHHRRGGLIDSIYFGTEQQIQSLREFRLSTDIFLFGSILMMGLYHFVLYFRRRKERSTLYFGIFCLLVALRPILSNEQYLHSFFSAQSWEWLLKVQYLTLFCASLVFNWFLFSIFPQIYSKKILWGISLASAGFALLTLVTPAKIYSHAPTVFNFILLAGISQNIYTMGVALKKKREGALIFLLGFSFFALTIINDALHQSEIISTGYYGPLGLFIFIFSQSHLLSLRFTKAFARVENLTNAYEPFVPKQILQELGKQDILEVTLGDFVERKNMSILFADIRSFTTLSEALTPQENFKFLNSYLERMAPSIHQNNGLIDQYIGDAIMALFPQSPDDALKAAISMQEALGVYNQHRKNQGYPPIKVGIGINTGRIILGTIGAQDRMQETVIGDAVNVAARLQELTKNYQTNILISENTFEGLENPESFDLALTDRVTMRGKTQPVAIWSVLDEDLPEVKSASFEKQTL